MPVAVAHTHESAVPGTQGGSTGLSAADQGLTPSAHQAAAQRPPWNGHSVHSDDGDELEFVRSDDTAGLATRDTLAELRDIFGLPHTPEVGTSSDASTPRPSSSSIANATDAFGFPTLDFGLTEHASTSLWPAETSTAASFGTASLLANGSAMPPATEDGGDESDDRPLPHVCPHCGKDFTRKSDLGRHSKIHTGDRAFLCVYPGCGKTFIQRSALQVHRRTHTGEKPHACEYPGCSKTFADSSSLARHRRVHTGQRPYRCEADHCDRAFTRRETLISHMKTHDPTWEADPTVKYSFSSKPKAKRRKVAHEDGGRVPVASTSIAAEGVVALLQDALLSQPGVSTGDLSPLEEQITSISQEIAATLDLSQSTDRGGTGEPGADAGLPPLSERDGSERDAEGLAMHNAPGAAARAAIPPSGAGTERDAELDRLLADALDEDDEDYFPVPLRARKPASMKRKK